MLNTRYDKQHNQLINYIAIQQRNKKNYAALMNIKINEGLLFKK